METIIKQQKYIDNKINKVPKELIYEIIDDKAIYYKNYELVLKKQKKFIDIMGSSIKQSTLIDLIVENFHLNNKDRKYKLRYSELGLHLDSKNNLAVDIAFYKTEDLKKIKITNTYITIPPQVVIEIDTKASLNDFDNLMDYIDKKTEKLLNFGVEKIYWFLTKNEKIIKNQLNNKQKILNWNDTIEPINNFKFSLKKLIDNDELIF